jgi:hypothetical protein
MRFTDIAKRNGVPVCYCEMDEDADDYDADDYDADDSDYDSDDETNYTVLRSGSMIPKVNS